MSDEARSWPLVDRAKIPEAVLSENATRTRFSMRRLFGQHGAIVCLILLGLVLFDLGLVCVAEQVGRDVQPAADDSPATRISRSNDCKDQLISILRKPEFLGLA